MKELLGKKARDRITGFTGIITSIIYYLDSDTEIQLESIVDDENRNQSLWFAHSRIEIKIENGEEK